MIYIKTPTEIEAMQPACTLASQTLGELAKWIKPGVTTNKLETIAREYIRDNGGTPACLGYAGFPAAVCWEVNETVVHGFPSNYTLREGDILGTDIVVEIGGFNGDMCYTFPVGEISPEVKALCVTTKESLYIGIEAAKEGNRVGDISNAIQTYCEAKGYSVVREMCGHGIGRKMHEEPEVPNFGKKSTGPMLRNGMCIAIEPMINLGARQVIIEKDGWTCRTRDRKPSAHYEHTIAIQGNTPRILTTFSYIEEVLQQRFI
ncbi:MAG: type I methionyl aminopeptidase [Paramuribaculum sp.]|nr:type I methionyl aminopeptidase [Paramuribaculum sp.]MDE6652729.1 type I methionyl aminopeptidase [Paramuribaculum sp.]